MKTALAITLTVTITIAQAHDGSLPYAGWMNSLMRPDIPVASCCGTAEQYWVREYQPTNHTGMAFRAIVISHDGQTTFPVYVPKNKVIWDEPNPTGRGVIFIRDEDRESVVVCFVPSHGI